MGWLPSLPWSKKTSTAEPKYTSPWQLLEVSDSDVERAAKDIQNVASRKRRMSQSSADGSPKRVCRRSWGDDEYRMSGAL